jgi:alkylation response protein AidB-like acyl-CoA dehydrogenase
VDFDLNEDQRLLQDSVRRFLAEKAPIERVRSIMESEHGHDLELWRELHQLGIGSLVVPPRYGGLGSEFLDAVLVAEELGRACTPGPFLGNTMASIAFAESEDEQAKAEWLPKLANGETIVAVALGESGSEWRPEHLRAKGDDACVSGEKPLVCYGGLADAFLVAAVDSDGPGLWLVERDSPNVEVIALKGSDMTRRLDAVTFARARARRIGGQHALTRTLDAGLLLLAADAYGGARKCLDMTVKYALEREQFGQPIGAFQAVKHQLADMTSVIEPALAFLWYAAHAYDRMPEQVSRHSAMAKAWLCDLFDRTVAGAIELHGGIGFTWEFDLHLWFRRAIFDRSFLGDSNLHRERAAAMAGW